MIHVYIYNNKKNSMQVMKNVPIAALRQPSVHLDKNIELVKINKI